MKYFFPIHLDGGNRGCEAIAKGTALLLEEKKENLLGLCTNVNLDIRLGVNQSVTLVPARKPSLLFRIRYKFYRIFVRDIEKQKNFSFRYYYNWFLNQMSSKDIMLSTGGDMMCYGNNQVNYTADYLTARGIKSILWGCSIGEKNLTPEKLRTLKNFSWIYARESLTKEVLLNHGIDKVVVYPDPAFILQPEECKLPECFIRGDVIGINLSNFVIGGFSLNTDFAAEVKALVEYILKSTDLHILLIPHVLWEKQDDRIVSNALLKLYNSPRVSILDTNVLNYCQIRYVISKCSYFIGARTHSMISAYSTCVPSIAIGYSIKARGIAKDLSLSDRTLVNSKNFHQGELVQNFDYLRLQSASIKSHLQSIIPAYKERCCKLKDKIRKTEY